MSVVHEWVWPIQDCPEGGVLHLRSGRAWVTLGGVDYRPEEAAEAAALLTALGAASPVAMATLASADDTLKAAAMIDPGAAPKMVAAGVGALAEHVWVRQRLSAKEPAPGPRRLWRTVAFTFDRDPKVRRQAMGFLDTHRVWGSTPALSNWRRDRLP